MGMECFAQMTAECQANDKTFSILLSACSHSGDDKTAKHIWSQLIENEQLRFDVFIMTSLSDCIARKGQLHEAFDLFLQFDNYSNGKADDEVMHTALMAAYQKHKNVLIAQSVYDRIKKKFKDKTDYMASSSVLLSNLYKDAMNER